MTTKVNSHTSNPPLKSSPPPTPRNSTEARTAAAAQPAFEIGMEARENTDPLEIHGVLNSAEHPNTFSHSSFIWWEGKRYLFELKLPVVKQPKGKEKEEFDRAIKEYKDVFLTHLKQQVRATPDAKIRPGTDFSVIFTEEGYVAYIPDETKPSIDPTNYTDDELQSPLRVETPEAQLLTDLVHLGESKKIFEGLKNEKLTQYQKKTAIPQTGPGPVRLQNNGENLCYLNTAFQLFGGNPAIRQKLLKEPQSIEGSALHKALEDYEKKTLRHLGALRDELKFKKGKQGHTNEALTLMRARIGSPKWYHHQTILPSTDSWNIDKDSDISHIYVDRARVNAPKDPTLLKTVPLSKDEKELTGFSIHEGADGAGHYRAYVKEGDKWWNVSDSNVTAVTRNIEDLAKQACDLIYTKTELLG